MNKCIFSVTLFCFIALSSPAIAHGPHEHGVARKDVAVDGSVVEIGLESPLANALAFEHAPRTDTEREAVRSMAATLRNAENIFVLPAAAQCRLTSVSLCSGQLPPELLGEKTSPQTPPVESRDADGKREHENHAEHGDLDAAFVFTCARPEALHGMDVRLFSAWPALRELHVQMVTPVGQRAGELNDESHALAW